jgi:hypothetical protein
LFVDFHRCSLAIALHFRFNGLHFADARNCSREAAQSVAMALRRGISCLLLEGQG